MLTVADAILKSTKYLQAKGVDSPRLDAELLLAHVMGCDRLRLYMDWHKPLIELEVGAYRESIRQRGQERVPVARLLGRKEFYGRDFEILPDVFVPRPETEGLVERALDALSGEAALQMERPTVFEIGTGSGAIIVSLAAENGTPHYIASDLSTAALAAANANARRHKVEARIQFREGPLLAGFEGALHLVVSNPPYIPEGEVPGLPPEVSRHDPVLALQSGRDGLDCARAIVREAGALLVPGGVILLELGEDHEDAILRVFAQDGRFRDARMEKDFSGRPRYAFARRQG